MKPRKNSFNCSLYAYLILVLAVVTQSLAGIVGTTGDVVNVDGGPPPSSVLLGATESDTEVKFFTERGGVTLATPINVDV